MSTLAVFSDRALVGPGLDPVVMLAPFWKRAHEDPRDPNAGRFDGYAATGRSLFRMTTLPEADLAVLPVDWGDARRDPAMLGQARAFVERARRAGKPTLIFFGNDSPEPIPLDDVLVFRTSLLRSRRRRNEFAMPAFSEDFVARYLGGRLPVSPPCSRARVGFCGRVPPFRPFTWKQRVGRQAWPALHRLRIALGRPTGSGVRLQALAALRRSPSIEPRFVLHDQFFGGAVLPSGATDVARMAAARREYLQNMIESDYVLCVRGEGNFSLRLYETLSCGRIPVFLDTDCVLPFHAEIDWRAHCVWVDESELAGIAGAITAFHRRLSPGDFVALQRRCRRLWEEWLSPSGFFARLHAQLAAMLDAGGRG